MKYRKTSKGLNLPVDQSTHEVYKNINVLVPCPKYIHTIHNGGLLTMYCMYY